MRPKGKLFALLAVFAAIGIVTATGAFTTVDAQRTVNVGVSGDSAALLAMDASDSPNGAYADTDGTDITVDISDQNPSYTDGDFDGKGVNDNATTTMDHVFNITNQGTQEVEVTVSYASQPNGFHLYNDTESNTDLKGQTVTLGQGDSMSIGVYVNTTQGGFTEDTVDVTIQADAT